MTAPTARIVRITETGEAEGLRIFDEAVPAPGKDEILLRVEAIGLNRAEVMFRNGTYLESPALPSRIGYEAAGTVEAVGSGVHHVAVGDRVSTIPAFSMSDYGVYGERVVVPAHAVAHYPAHYSPQQGTAIWMQYLTSYGALVHIGMLKAGEAVLITAASSSVGIAAIQMAKYIGAAVIATTRSRGKKAALKAAGADHVIVTDEEDLVARVKEITAGQGVRLIFDPIGGPILNQLADAAATGGIIIEYGALDTEATPFPLFPALGKGLTIRGYTLFELRADAGLLQRAKDYVLVMLANGGVEPLLDREFKLSDIAAAHRYMEANNQIGKIIVTP